jgi:hypothetical protein
MINTKDISKFFTEKEANSSLVLVSRIALDLDEKAKKLQILKSKLVLEEIVEDDTTDNHQHFQQIQELGNQIIHNAYELEEIGVQILNISPLIIGFPHIQDNEITFFTWTLNQDKVKKNPLPAVK